jgi:hypothetical protein
MKVSMNGLRKNIAREFNEALSTVTGEIWENFDEDDKEKWHELRSSLAFLLLVHGDDMEEIDPDKWLSEIPE